MVVVVMTSVSMRALVVMAVVVMAADTGHWRTTPA